MPDTAVLIGCARPLKAAWRAGNALLAAKAQCKHGTWMDWVKANFAGSQETANVYMRLAKSQRATNLDPQKTEMSIRQGMPAILHTVCAVST
jgi:Protein of unknown function (DUF3102)